MTLAVVTLLLPAAAPPAQAASSVNLEATYDTVLKLAWTSRAVYVDSRATITNTSGAAINRVEFNTIATRLGGIRLQPTRVDGATVAATISDQTISVPLGKSLANGATTMVQIRYSATLRSTLSGSNWLFTKANGIMDLYRWLPWVSRRIAFNRPNHGDPFMTPVEPAGEGPDRRRPQARVRHDRRSDRDHAPTGCRRPSRHATCATSR